MYTGSNMTCSPRANRQYPAPDGAAITFLPQQVKFAPKNALSIEREQGAGQRSYLCRDPTMKQLVRLILTLSIIITVFAGVPDFRNQF